MSRLVFLDTETTGLDPDRHEIWELAIINDETGTEWEFHFPVDLARADPTGLRIGRFYERRNALGQPHVEKVSRVSRWRTNGEAKWWTEGAASMAETVARLLDGAHIVGAVPSFDAAFLTRWLNTNGQAATWHYHLVDVEALAAGFIAGSRSALATAAHHTGEPFWATSATFQASEGCDHNPPWKSSDLSLAVGVDPGDYDRHTALGDARWAKAIYDAVMRPGAPA